jgi:uncharacterized protein (UPF0332 family)
VSPKPKDELAREHADSAREDLEAGREKDAVNAMFYAAEAAVVSLADQHGIDTKQQHGLKADAATELHQRGVLSEDYGPLLKQLNQVRKDVWYEGDDPEFDTGIDEVLERVGELVDAAEAKA